MGRRKKRCDDDDGRVIASMSDLNLGRPGRLAPQNDAHSAPEDSDPPAPPFSPVERRMYALAALKAALLIGLAFIGGLGLIIWLITLL